MIKAIYYLVACLTIFYDYDIRLWIRSWISFLTLRRKIINFLSVQLNHNKRGQPQSKSRKMFGSIIAQNWRPFDVLTLSWRWNYLVVNIFLHITQISEQKLLYTTITRKEQDSTLSLIGYGRVPLSKVCIMTTFQRIE